MLDYMDEDIQAIGSVVGDPLYHWSSYLILSCVFGERASSTQSTAHHSKRRNTVLHTCLRTLSTSVNAIPIPYVDRLFDLNAIPKVNLTNSTRT